VGVKQLKKQDDYSPRGYEKGEATPMKVAVGGKKKTPQGRGSRKERPADSMERKKSRKKPARERTGTASWVIIEAKDSRRGNGRSAKCEKGRPGRKKMVLFSNSGQRKLTARVLTKTALQ